MSKNQGDSSKPTFSYLRSQFLFWQELSEIEQESLSGGFNTEGDVDRPIILGLIRSSKGGTANNTMAHEIGHAHGRPVIISWKVDFNA